MHKGALRQSSAPLLLAAAIVAIVALLLVHRPAVRMEAVQSLRVSETVAPKPISVPSISGVYGVLHAQELRAAVVDYRAQDDEDRRLSRRQLRALIDQSCRVPQLLQMDGRDAPDWRRDRFVDELQRRCSGWAVPSMFVPEYSWDVVLQVPPTALSAEQALAELRAARDPQALRRSWWQAYRLDALPQAQIFADQRRLLPAEAQQLIEVVIDWRQCARFAACGPDSLLTVRVCAMHGCRGDEDLLGAWHAALSPRDFESAQAIADWLPRWVDDG